jgi:prevent-host-death family protein
MEIDASEFKAKCLALPDDVALTGEPVTILKHGQPVAQVVPVVPREGQFP